MYGNFLICAAENRLGQTVDKRKAEWFGVGVHLDRMESNLNAKKKRQIVIGQLAN